MNRPSVTAETIFGKAIEIADPANRAAYLDHACENDHSLRGEVERLVHDHFLAGDFLGKPAIAIETTPGHTSREAIGALIGPYKLLEQIGEGGMGVVYMAQQTQPVKRRVALKVIKPGMDSRQVVARFEAERQALAMMDHPNIAKIFDAGVVGPVCRTGPEAPDYFADQGPAVGPICRMGPEAPAGNAAQGPARQAGPTGRPFFVMELVRGIAITDYCDRKKLNTHRRLELFADVCRAVQHAHQKAIIHRDLKPSNVLVTLHDGVPVVKVIDFGVAKALNQELTERTLFTQFSQMIGTPLYMSPEQAELSGLDIDTRSDIYSLGVLLYELLTGTTPFDKETLSAAGFDEMRRIIREEEPETVSTRLARTRNSERGTRNSASAPRSAPGHPLRGSAPRLNELDWIVMKALAKDRSERYESASALAKDIERYLSDEPVHACPPSAVYRLHKFARKNKAALTTAAVIAASLILGTTVSAWQAVRATQAEAQATANEAKAKTEEQRALAAVAAERSAKVAEIAQRKQTEKNFKAALETVDRLLANVSDPELTDVPRVGPLRRKILADTVGFYERIPLHDSDSVDIRLRLARTWDRIATLSRDVDEVEQARRAYQTAISLFGQLASEHPGDSKCLTALAGSKKAAGYFYLSTTHEFPAAEQSFRTSSELFAEAGRLEPSNKSYLLSQAHSQTGLAQALSWLRKHDEAIEAAGRALALIESPQVGPGAERANLLYDLAFVRWTASPGQAEDLLRRSLNEYRSFNASGNRPEQNYRQFAAHLHSTAVIIAERHPEEANELWDESIALWHKVNGPTQRVRIYLDQYVKALVGQGNHLLRLAAESIETNELERASSQRNKAESRFEEAVIQQRQMAMRYALPSDRFRLVTLLHEQAQYFSNHPDAKNRDTAADRVQADALLTEAIQNCRHLAAEFPDNIEYRDRLDSLLKLHVQYFGQQIIAQPKAETTPPPKPDGG